ncbi:YceI family protein [Tatumella citrea]|uniref:Polyisoprenoid-binding protein n=1 Tax=Tatumella citrea TaxID=53336 RepID=A0A1Y0L6N7_TATCI|nr:YceI family protein [Tatumella citrea]ARU93339.1 polyisoprenoid-binding protein [Tatumella citrea]ARU97377.1 polyisoprenoid-binding protein [Tatumella citrea]
MRFNKALLPLITLASLYIPLSHAQELTYQLDPNHTSVIVTWNHFGFSHPTANIPSTSGTLVFDPQHPAKAKLDVTIPVSQIDTHVPALTTEFRGDEYFDVAKYPTATFHSTKVVAKGHNKYDVYGDLTLKGITKPVTLHATLNKLGEQPMLKKPAVGFDATATLKRSEFKLDQFIPAVADEVTLTISTEAHSQ